MPMRSSPSPPRRDGGCDTDMAVGCDEPGGGVDLALRGACAESEGLSRRDVGCCNASGSGGRWWPHMARRKRLRHLAATGACIAMTSAASASWLEQAIGMSLHKPWLASAAPGNSPALPASCSPAMTSSKSRLAMRSSCSSCINPSALTRSACAGFPAGRLGSGSESSAANTHACAATTALNSCCEHLHDDARDSTRSGHRHRTQQPQRCTPIDGFDSWRPPHVQPAPANRSAAHACKLAARHPRRPRRRHAPRPAPVPSPSCPGTRATRAATRPACAAGQASVHLACTQSRPAHARAEEREQVFAATPRLCCPLHPAVLGQPLPRPSPAMSSTVLLRLCCALLHLIRAQALRRCLARARAPPASQMAQHRAATAGSALSP
eukprot:364965-Chlamydomonas_euryale.AAC.6